MQIRIFTLQFNPAIGGFDDDPLRNFLIDKDVRSITPQFFSRDGAPFWTVLISYEVSESRTERAAPRENPREDWRKTLKKEDWGVFNALREWRKERAQKEGVPPYLLFTNKQLTQIVQQRVSSLTALGGTAGVGASRVEKYGKDVLRILATIERERERQDGGKRVESIDGVDGLPEMAVEHNGQVPEEGAVHADESDRQPGPRHD